MTVQYQQHNSLLPPHLPGVFMTNSFMGLFVKLKERRGTGTWQSNFVSTAYETEAPITKLSS
ncbi:hypothetical protein ACJX0J_019194, partial [Zea mays]